MPLSPARVNPYLKGLCSGFEEKGAMCMETGMAGSCCRASTGGVPGGRVTDHILQVAGWACCSGLSGEEGKTATFPELIRLYYFLFGKPQIEECCLLPWELTDSLYIRNSQTVPWDLFFFNHLISFLGNFKPAYNLSLSAACFLNN